HPEWEAVAPGLKSLDDALEIRRRIFLAFEAAERESNPEKRQAWLTFVVVGAGATGVELAGTIAEIARHTVAKDFRSIDPKTSRVLLIEAGPRVLPTFATSLSDHALKSLQRLGVEVRIQAPVTQVAADGVELGGERIASRTILWAAGVAASPLAKSLGVPLDRSGRVIVEKDCTIPGYPEVFVVGDLAAYSHGLERPLPGVAPVAMQMGTYAGQSLLRALQGKERKPFRYVDRGSMATIGRAAGIADVFGLKLSGFLGWLAWLFLHVLFLIGFKNKLVVLIQWTWSYLTFRRGARLITGRPRLDITPNSERSGALAEETQAFNSKLDLRVDQS
ncbi:MAG: NAD(P)/FAD-dependent oxidoreductase, partial [Myxococcaceae bacterium]